EGDHIEATCPWGNKFKIYEPGPEHGNIMIGTQYVQFDVPMGTAEGIAAFYGEALLAPGRVEEVDGAKAAIIDVGQYQELIYRETENVPEYDGHHIAVYIANFSAAYDWLSKHGLVTEEPRNHQLR